MCFILPSPNVTDNANIEEEDKEEDKTTADLAVEAELAALEADRKATEAAEQAIIEDRNAKAAELEAQLLSMHKNKKNTFDLYKDLERIQCSHFYDILHKAGFHDEGSFSEITHECLMEKGIWIPRKARTRMVALAVSLKGRIDQRMRRKSVAKDHINSSMLSDGELKGVSIEGIDTVLTNKKDIKDAYDKKMHKEAEEAREKRMILQAIEDEAARRLNPLPKMHSMVSITLMIVFISHIRALIHK